MNRAGDGRRLNVLVMSERLQPAQACIQSFGRAGHAVFVTYSGEQSPNAFSKYVVERVHAIAGHNTIDSMARALARVVRQRSIDVVVPLHDQDALVAAAARDRNAGASMFVMPPTESIRVASDKLRTMKVAQDTGIRVPPTSIAANLAEVRSIIARDGLPIVLKVPSATASAGTFVIRTPRQIDEISGWLPAGPYLLQSFIEGRRIGISGFAMDGRLVDSFSFESLSEEGQGGTPIYALSVSGTGAIEMLERLCELLNWTGGIDADLMLDQDGALYLLEINPRFSGTLAFADKMGVDLPRYYAQVTLGETLAPPPRDPVPDGVLFVAAWPGEIAMISRNPAAGQAKAAAMRQGRTVVDNLYPDDGPLMAAQMKSALYVAWNTPRIA